MTSIIFSCFNPVIHSLHETDVGAMTAKKQDIKRKMKKDEAAQESISDIRKKIKHQQDALLKIIKNIQKD